MENTINHRDPDLSKAEQIDPYCPKACAWLISTELSLFLCSVISQHVMVGSLNASALSGPAVGRGPAHFCWIIPGESLRQCCLLNLGRASSFSYKLSEKQNSTLGCQWLPVTAMKRKWCCI